MPFQPSQTSDEQVLLLLKSHGNEAMQLIFRNYHAALCASAYRLVGHEDIAKDLVQDVFIRLWSHRMQLQIHISLKAYLKRSVINAALSYLEKEQKLKRLSLEEANEVVETDTWEAAAHAQDLQTTLSKAMDALPPACRTVFMLSRFEELSNAQIADYLQISVKAVEKHMTKALKRLRNAAGLAS